MENREETQLKQDEESREQQKEQHDEFLNKIEEILLTKAEEGYKDQYVIEEDETEHEALNPLEVAEQDTVEEQNELFHEEVTTIEETLLTKVEEGYEDQNVIGVFNFEKEALNQIELADQDSLEEQQELTSEKLMKIEETLLEKSKEGYENQIVIWDDKNNTKPLNSTQFIEQEISKTELEQHDSERSKIEEILLEKTQQNNKKQKIISSSEIDKESNEPLQLKEQEEDEQQKVKLVEKGQETSNAVRIEHVEEKQIHKLEEKKQGKRRNPENGDQMILDNRIVLNKETNTEKQLHIIDEKTELNLQRTLVRRRSYSINISSKIMIDKFEKLGFKESKPITLTVRDINSNKSESYIRIMGKITGKKYNRGMTFSLGSDIGDLYDFDTKQKVTVKVQKNKMVIALNKQNYNYRFIITPSIDQNQKYCIRRAYTDVSDYIGKFSTKEISVLKHFGFKPSNDVIFNVYQKKPVKFLEQSVIRLGESRKVGQNSYQIKLGLPQTTLKRLNFGDSRLIKFTITPNEMVLTPVRKDNPLKEEQEYNYYFTITPFKEKKIGISQRDLERINHYYAAYIGYEFERLGQSILPYLFPNAQIYRQREYQIKIDGKEKLIRPDATILENDRPMTFVDFKKSIGAIRPRTLNYLRYFPTNQLIICVLEEFGQSWEKKHIKNKLKKMGLNETEKEEILKRITILHTSDIASRLPKEKKRELETKITKIQNILPKDRLDALKKAKELTAKTIERLNELGISEEVIGRINKPTRGILYSLQSLLILERLASSDYETVKSLADHEGLKDERMVQLRLRQLEQLGIVKEKCFRVGLSNRHYYYYCEKKPPELTDILEPLAVNGLKILMRKNYIPEKEVDDKILKRIIGPSWLPALKISSIINEKKIITMEDLTSDENIKTESHYQVLYSLQKIGAVNHYRIRREVNDHKVVYFFTHDFPRGLNLSDQINFLKPYQQTIINEFKKNGLEIPELNTFNEWLGDHWLVALRIYNLTLTDEDLPQTTNKTKIFNLCDLVQRMDDCSMGIRKALTKLEEIGVLDRYPWFEKSYYFQLKGTEPIPLTDNPLLPKNIQKPLRSIEKVSNIHFQDLAHLREILTRHWRNSLRIYNILSKIDTSYSMGFSRNNLIKILKQHNITLKNLARYIKPLKDTGVLFTYTNKQQMFYQLRH